MGLNQLKVKIGMLLKKNKYVLLILIIGLIFMFLPNLTNVKSSKKEQQNSDPATVISVSLEEKLANILSSVQGAGNVKVLLTQSAGEETIYQVNSNISENNDSGTTQLETVILTDADRLESGMVRQINPPTYQGAIIICDGADNANVRLAIVDAVSKVTGLGANRISVIKMK